MDRSKKLFENEKGALLCFLLLTGLLILTATISAKIAVGSDLLEGTAFLNRSTGFSADTKGFLEMLHTSAIRFVPTAITVLILFMLADSVFLFPTAAAVVALRGAVIGISLFAITGTSEIVQVVFYGSMSLFFLILISFTVGVRLSLPCSTKPQKYLVEYYLIFSGLGFLGELLLPFIL